MRSQGQAGPFGVRLVIETDGKKWARVADLPFAPFPGMGIRVDAYEVLNVVTVVVDEPGGAVTCLVVDDEGRSLTAEKCASLGFVACGPSDPTVAPAASPVRVSVITFADSRQWSKVCTLPFSPFDGLRVRMNEERVLKIFTTVVGDNHTSEVECFAGFDGEGADTVTGDECEALGFEEDCR
ncbi:hypothetical protein [Kitasatospora sp. NPDC085879]|uniref:hypothetical protein n=1 Tax=Kitasatospora sp. NPDC085879 TaxID=3154769 RepID=UPI0034330072